VSGIGRLSHLARQRKRDGHRPDQREAQLANEDLRENASPHDVTKREVAIIRRLTRRGSAAGAAIEVNLSERHTRRVIEGLRQRLGLHNSYGLVAWASMAGLIKASDLRDSVAGPPS